MAFSWLVNGGNPNHLLSGMILQVRRRFVCFFGPMIDASNGLLGKPTEGGMTWTKGPMIHKKW